MVLLAGCLSVRLIEEKVKKNSVAKSLKIKSKRMSTVYMCVSLSLSLNINIY